MSGLTSAATRFMGRARPSVTAAFASWDPARVERRALPSRRIRILGAGTAGVTRPSFQLLENAMADATTRTTPDELNRALDEVMRRPEFSWRLPREIAPPEDSAPGFWRAWILFTQESFRKGFRTVSRWLKGLLEWLIEKLRPEPDSTGHRGDIRWMLWLRILLFALLAVVACAAAILALRVWRRRRRVSRSAASEAVPVVPNLEDETVGADLLPEEGWIQVAAEMTAAGEWRLAVRALYLAGLAHLAARDLIRIAKFKSNLDYERELARRARERSRLREAFAANRAVFDRVWYGSEMVTFEILEAFRAQLSEMTEC